MRNDDDDPIEHHGDTPAKPTRDARGRWLKGHCPNPHGRPRKTIQADYDPGDIRHFGNTLIDVATNGRIERMTRRAALLHKMYADAMKGKVTMQRVMHAEFERNDKRMAAARLRYEQLMIRWVIENDEFDGLDGDSIPFEVQLEILGLESLLSYYYPGQYPNRGRTVRKEDPYAVDV